ncbi:MAG TPA: glycerophosphodiester phosphodiesterase [Dehalococcoidia bacterium]|nr:glycerophosphodiester phosphodiesterase [Dehalococcoidia bacterium]
MTDAGTRRPIVIAHRHGNDLALLGEAARAGAAFVEADVWAYRGRLEVRHAKTLGPTPLIWDRWYVRRRPARPLVLEEVLAALPAGMGIMIDLKGSDRRLPEMLLSALQGHGGAGPVMVSARFWDHLPSLRAHPELTLFHSVGSAGQLRRVRPLLELRENDAISIHYQLLDATTVRSLKGQVSMVATWPINDEERLREVVGWGVDAAITDSLDIVKNALAKGIGGRI